MFIEGFGISSYRSFGQLQNIGPFAKINFFVGQNNSGKSNILSFLQNHYRLALKAAASGAVFEFKDLDRHEGLGRDEIHFSTCIPIGSARHDALRDKFAHHRNAFDQLSLSEILNPSGRAMFIPFAVQNESLQLDSQFVTKVANATIIPEKQWAKLWSVIHDGRTGGNALHNWIPDTLQFLGRYDLKDAIIERVDAIRQIGSAGQTKEGFSGKGIIQRLAQLQSPTLSERADKNRFLNITNFLKRVTGNSDAELDIPHDQSAILVQIENRTLPIESLGTGIHEVVILAAAATVLTDQVLCIEEPELHLHPILQKKLVRYLSEKTSNQYFFTTHSTHILDTSDASIFHIRLQDGATTVEPAYSSAERSEICADLGYRASDLLQSNCAIWVEGPSDRVYLNHWIRAVDSDLIEGVHYAIMFYGGRLLNHLTANDPEVTDFISLRRLNRYISIVMDSDKSDRYKKINKTKERIQGEFDVGPGFAWVTKGREIENYVPAPLLLEALKLVHPNATKLESADPFAHALHYRTATRRLVKDAIDKVKVAHAVAEKKAVLNVLDLRSKVDQMVQFIHQANDSEISFLN